MIGSLRLLLGMVSNNHKAILPLSFFFGQGLKTNSQRHSDNEYGYACRLLDLVRFIHEYDNGKVPTPTASGVQTPSGVKTPILRSF